LSVELDDETGFVDEEREFEDVDDLISAALLRETDADGDEDDDTADALDAEDDAAGVGNTAAEPGGGGSGLRACDECNGCARP
jgi:hypothetical protein